MEIKKKWRSIRDSYRCKPGKPNKKTTHTPYVYKNLLELLRQKKLKTFCKSCKIERYSILRKIW